MENPFENLPQTSSLTEYEQRYWQSVFSKKEQRQQENKNLPAKIQLNSLVVPKSLDLPSVKSFRQVRKMQLRDIATSDFTSLGKYQKLKKDFGVNLCCGAVITVYKYWGSDITDEHALDLSEQIVEEFPTLSPEQVFFALDNIPTKKYKLSPKLIIETLREFDEQKTLVAAEVAREKHLQNKFYEPSDNEAAKEVEKAAMRAARIFELKSKSTEDV